MTDKQLIEENETLHGQVTALKAALNHVANKLKSNKSMTRSDLDLCSKALSALYPRKEQPKGLKDYGFGT